MINKTRLLQSTEKSGRKAAAVRSNARRVSAKSIDAPTLLLENQLCFALYSASLAMTKVYRPLLVQMGLTYPQYIVLLVLWERDGMTVSEIGERLSLDSGTLTPLLKRLQSMALITRTRGMADERQVLVTLTAQGAALRSRAGPLQSDVACATGCTTEQRVAMTQSLHRLRDSLRTAAAH